MPTEPAPTGPSTVTIAGKTFPVRAILAIGAEEHYVCLRFADRSLLLRDTFSAVLAQLEPTAGVHTHRSFWVNADHVEAMVTDRKGQAELRLSNGDMVPVSRRRRRDCEVRFNQTARQTLSMTS